MMALAKWSSKEMKLEGRENRGSEKQRMLNISSSLSLHSPANGSSCANAGPRHCISQANAEEMKLMDVVCSG